MPDSLQDFSIAITRPLAQAQKLSALIEAEGGKTISFPLIDIVPLEDYQLFDHVISAVNDYDWAIFISSNAVQHGMPRLLKSFNPLPEQLKFAAIGPITSQELKSFGVSEVLSPELRFDSESLLALEEMQAVAGKRVMIFRGEGGREVLANTLKARGAKVEFAECYKRINPQRDTSLLETLWKNNQCHAIVVTSSEAMRHLLDMSEGATEEWLQNIPVCVNHARIAEEALRMADSSIASQLRLSVAEAPGDIAMLACLKKTLLN